MSLLLKSLIALIGSLSLLAEEPPLILEGRGEGRKDFQYWLMTDQNGEPVRSFGTQSPIYQGIRPSRVDGDPPTIVNESFDNLLENGLIENAVEHEETPWVSNIAHVEVDYGIIQKMFEDWAKNKEQFMRLFASSPEMKARIFSQLLFDSNFILDAKSLKSLRTTAYYPNPEPIRFPIPVALGKRFDIIWKFFADTYFDIYVSKLNLSFGRKTLIFNQKDQALDIQIDLSRADISGMIHGIGRIKNISDFFNLEDNKFNRFNPNFWSVKAVLVGAEIGAVTVTFSLKLYKDQDGFWRIKLSKPLNLKFNVPEGEEPKAIIKMVAPQEVKIVDDQFVFDEKFVERKESKLDDKTIERIERTLAEPLESALGNILFPEDLGFQIPVSPFKSELQDGLSKFQVKLSDLKWGPDKLLIAFDGRMRIFKKPECLKSLETSDKDWQLDSAALSVPAPGNSTVQFESKAADDFVWKFSSSDAVPIKFGTDIKFIVSENGAQFIDQAATLAGFYCLSSRSIWPRPDFFPLLEFAPTQFSKLKLANDQMTASLFGRLMIYERDFKVSNEKFVLKTSEDFKADLPFSNNSHEKKVAWSLPLSVNVESWGEDENQSLNTLLTSGRKQLGERALIPFEFSYKILSHFMGSSENALSPFSLPWIKDFSLSADKITVRLGLEESPYGPPKGNPDEVILDEPRKPETVLIRSSKQNGESYDYVTEPFLTLKWKIDPKNPQAYSWRMKSNISGEWSNWKPFKFTDHLLYLMEKPGRYEFQVKAMNRLYQIEEEPVRYEVYYEPNSDIAIKPKESKKTAEVKSAVETPEKSNEEPKRVGAMGVFGCTLSESRTANWQEMLVLIFFAFILFSLRNRFSRFK